MLGCLGGGALTDSTRCSVARFLVLLALVLAASTGASLWVLWDYVVRVCFGVGVFWDARGG